jgi:L-galactose dehydrogenase/L-glyceraldehyde 3-phosphate reductase
MLAEMIALVKRRVRLRRDCEITSGFAGSCSLCNSTSTMNIQQETMRYRPLGNTGIEISALSFGAGPISTLMVGDDGQRQRAVIQTALDCGINWFDTAATYGGGQSERNLGCVLAELGAAERVHVATKVRLAPEELGDIRSAVRRSFEASLERLKLPRVTLLQLHNSITAGRGDEPTSITPADVLGPGGVAEAFEELQSEGLVRHLGLTGIGQPAAIEQVIRSRRFATMQTPYHLLNPSAGRPMGRPKTNGFAETDYGNIIGACAQTGMGVLAIRVLAGGALAQRPPSPHTLKTPFFPLPLYERDRLRAARLQTRLGADRPLAQEAIRFVLSHPSVSSALIGFGDAWQIDAALAALNCATPPLSWDDVLAVNASYDSEE